MSRRNEGHIEKIIGETVERCDRARLREATRDIIAPLIHRADVSERLKDRALAPPPAGIHPDDLPWPNAEVEEVLAGFVEEGRLRKNTRGAYELGTEMAEPTGKEAAELAEEILAGWPEDERAKIVMILTADGDEDEEQEG